MDAVSPVDVLTFQSVNSEVWLFNMQQKWNS